MALAQIQPDIRDIIFETITDNQYIADIRTERFGVVAGMGHLKVALAKLGIAADFWKTDGDTVNIGAKLVTITGTAKEIAVAEEFAVGMLAKYSGIATAARQAVAYSGDELQIVCGAWKKVPPETKQGVREAIVIGGATFRIVDQPFLYLDKNFVQMLGGIEPTLLAVRPLADKLKVIQLKGNFADITQEAQLAVEQGADILMIDTGNLEDVKRVHALAQQGGWRGKVKLAFAKGIQLADIIGLKGQGIDILDIGTAIVDAPLLDMKLDVRKEETSCN